MMGNALNLKHEVMVAVDLPRDLTPEEKKLLSRVAKSGNNGLVNKHGGMWSPRSFPLKNVDLSYLIFDASVVRLGDYNRLLKATPFGKALADYFACEASSIN